MGFWFLCRVKKGKYASCGACTNSRSQVLLGSNVLAFLSGRWNRNYIEKLMVGSQVLGAVCAWIRCFLAARSRVCSPGAGAGASLALGRTRATVLPTQTRLFLVSDSTERDSIFLIFLLLFFPLLPNVHNKADYFCYRKKVTDFLYHLVWLSRLCWKGLVRGGGSWALKTHLPSCSFC